MEVDRVEGTASRADMIASRTAKTISERMDEDPVLYKKLSELLQEAITAHRLQRISDLEFLQRATQVMDQVRNRSAGDEPEVLRGREEASAFYRLVSEVLQGGDIHLPPERSASIGIQLDDIIRSLRIVDWTRNEDVKKRMEQAMEDHLYDLRHDGLVLGFDVIDQVLKGVMRIAETRYA
jgi:type I restriction enzyme R subunit